MREVKRERMLFSGYRVSVWGDRKVLEVDGGDGCTAMGIHLMPPNGIVKNDQNGKFYAYFTTVKKIKYPLRTNE